VWVEAEKRHIGMVFQEGALFPHLTVAQNVAYGLGRESAGRVLRVLDLVALGELAERYPDQLSGGQQQRVALARALAPEPRLVLLDEPFVSLDATLRERLRREVRRILRAAEVTALLVTHDQEEALSVADRVAVMMDGQVLQAGPPDEVYHRPATPEVARFIGDGVMIPCEVAEGKLSCLFGTVSTRAAAGPADLFLRPEDLEIEICAQPERAHGAIVERRFFGHDVLDRVRLTTGDEIQVRNLSSLAPPPGAPVRITLRPRDFTLFPR
jgi:iron(III) transport system ATP-binding protein